MFLLRRGGIGGKEVSSGRKFFCGSHKHSSIIISWLVSEFFVFTIFFVFVFLSTMLLICYGDSPLLRFVLFTKSSRSGGLLRDCDDFLAKIAPILLILMKI